MADGAIDTTKIPKDVKWAIWGLSISWLFWGPADAFWGLYLHSFGDSYTQVGWLISAGKILAILVAIPFGILADRFSARKVVLWATALIIPLMLAFYIAGLYGSVSVLIVALLAHGILRMLRNIGVYTYIKEGTPLQQSVHAWALFKSSSVGIWAIGMALGAIAILFFEVHELFLIVIIGLLIRLCIYYMISDPQKTFHTEYPEVHALSFIKRVRWGMTKLRELDARVWYMIVYTFFIGVVIGNFDVFIALFAEDLQFSKAHIALLLGVTNGAFLFGMPMYRLTKNMGKFTRMIMGEGLLLLVFVSIFLFVGTYPVVLFGLVFLYGIARTISHPVREGVLAAFTPKPMQGEISGIQWASMRIGNILGALLFGVVSDVFGLAHVFLSSGVLYGVIIIGLVLLGIKYEKHIRDVFAHMHIPYIYIPHVHLMHRWHIGRGIPGHHEEYNKRMKQHTRVKP